MRPLRNLTRDHDDIGVLLEELERSSQRLLDGDTATRTELVRLAEALAVLLDEVHFDKEEQILLPLLVRTGVLDWEADPARETLEENARERHLLEVLQHAAANERRWREPERQAIARTADELVAGQSRLMDVQDAELFPVAGRELDDARAAELVARLDGFDAELDPERVEGARRLVEHVREGRKSRTWSLP